MEVYLYQDLYNLENTHWWHIAKRKSLLQVIKPYLKSSRNKILDIGCGTGQNIIALKQFGQVWGIDSSKAAIEFCTKRHLKQVRLENSYKTSFRQNTFDLITMLDLLEHTDENKTLVEVHRILKPDGLVLITVPAYQFLWSTWDEVLHHKKRYTASDLKTVLEKHNFKILKTSYLYTFLVMPIMLVRFLKNRLPSQKYQSDFSVGNKITNSICNQLAHLERKIMLRYNLPFGTSVICLAQKKTQKRKK